MRARPKPPQKHAGPFWVKRERITERLPEAQEPVAQSWFKVIGPFEGCVRKQQAALAMISDFSLYSTAFSAFPYEQPEKVFIGASLDHAIWFHEVPDMSDWILYDTYSPGLAAHVATTAARCGAGMGS